MNVLELAGPPEIECPLAENRRREARRAARDATAQVYACGAEEHLFGKGVTITDLSLHGVGFISDQSFVVGRTYGLEIHGNWMNLSSRVRVVACHEGQVGAEFI